VNQAAESPMNAYGVYPLWCKQYQ